MQPEFNKPIIFAVINQSDFIQEVAKVIHPHLRECDFVQRDLMEIHQRYFYTSEEVDQIYSKRNTLLPLKTTKHLCPLFVSDCEKPMMVEDNGSFFSSPYRLSLERKPHYTLIGYFISYEPVRQMIQDKLVLLGKAVAVRFRELEQSI